jgi:hypothetical protein
MGKSRLSRRARGFEVVSNFYAGLNKKAQPFLYQLTQKAFSNLAK